MIISNPKKEQLKQIDDLATKTFLSKTPNESMAKRFPVLLGEDNLNHINIICEGNEIVADVNWYFSNIKSEDSVISIGSIGAVCTDEKARGKGYGDALVKHTFKQMESENVALCLISGTRSLYTRNGACIVGREYSFEFYSPKKSESTIHITNDQIHNYANLICGIHTLKDNRFIRNIEHTKKLLTAWASPLHNMVCELYYSDNAYALAQINLIDDSESIKIVEYAGDTSQIIEVFSHISYKTGKKLHGVIEDFNTDMLKAINSNVKLNPMCGSYRIINASLLFSQFKYRFARIGIKNIEIIKNNSLYEILIDGEKYFINEMNLHTLIFGSPENYDVNTLFEENKSPLNIDKAFPIQMPCVSGMDFI